MVQEGEVLKRNLILTGSEEVLEGVVNGDNQHE